MEGKTFFQKKILLTGGGGFLGGALARDLIEKGARLSLLTRRELPDLVNLGAQLFLGDLTDPELVSQACEGQESIFHVAALAGIWGPWEDFYRSNVLGSENILKGALKGGCKNLIYTSSPSVVFDGKPMENGNELAPYPDSFLCHYPHTKAMAEKQILESHQIGKLHTLALRPHLIWGPGDNHLIPRVLKKGKAGRLIKIGDGTNLVDTVYIDNAVQAHLLADIALCENPEAGGKPYFISNGEPLPLWDWVGNFLLGARLPPIKKSISPKMAYGLGTLAEAIWSLMGWQFEPPITRFLARELSESHWFDLTQAKTVLNYQPKISNQKGFELLFSSAYFKNLVENL